MHEPPPHFWGDLTVAYLHDPPDKPLDIRTHESRGREYAKVATGRDVTFLELTGAGKWADQRASEIERLPLPNAGADYHRAVGVEDGYLTICHPLSGNQWQLACPPCDKQQVAQEIKTIVADLDSPQARFLAIWRLLPSRLEHLHPGYRHLPAETRVPDHTIWNHLDITAGLYAAYAQSEPLAFLSLTIGPVQPFIESARSLRDLWTGSMLLSWLSFQSLLPVLEAVGPSALVFPQLRGNPLMDQWLQKEHFIPCQPDKDLLKSPCLPNRWIAVVPAGQALELTQLCETRFKEGWNRVADAVYEQLNPTLSGLAPNWDKYWKQQIGAFFDLNTQTLPWLGYKDETLAALYNKPDFGKAFPAAEGIRDLAEKIPMADRPGYKQDTAGRWQARIDLMGRMLEARRQIRPLRDYHPTGSVPPKCSLLGTFEQMGPADLRGSAQFWDRAAEKISGWTRLRTGERFCAIALCKRFAAENFLSQELGFKPRDLQFADTATLAASLWLEEAQLDTKALGKLDGGWSGQWLHYRSPHENAADPVPSDTWKMLNKLRSKSQAIPTYYTILKLDGDCIGQWLRGEKAPYLHEVMHPKTVRYYKAIEAQQWLENRRVVTPALHAAISEALSNYALYVVPDIVKKYSGVLVYAGGDDVLALLPTRTALACALELKQAYQGLREDGAPQGYTRIGNRNLLMMGPRATLSAGLAIVHYKEDLRLALEASHKSEKQAKDQKRDSLVLSICRRSGERTSSLCLWDELEWMQEWVELFVKGLPNRWAYRLRQVVPDLSGFDDLAPFQAEVTRQLNRMDTPGQRIWQAWFAEKTGQQIENLGREVGKYFAKFATTHDKRKSQPPASHLDDFAILCQSLSFLARGRDE